VVHEGTAPAIMSESNNQPPETIVDWFVKNFPDVTAHDWQDITRIGIVHRLDKDTSGALLLAKTPEVLTELQNQFKARTVQKDYVAFVFGIPKELQGTIETFVGRHPKRRQEQAILPIQQGTATRRIAITEYSVQKHYSYKNQPLGEILFHPKTGRMHQLRVHAKYLGTPILGDQVYTIKPAKRLSKQLGLTRQMLHASQLTFRHPLEDKRLTITATAPWPSDMLNLQDKLEN
jgi:23S rRNA pseudouridine1911/1915/1917 synthase